MNTAMSAMSGAVRINPIAATMALSARRTPICHRDLWKSLEKITALGRRLSTASFPAIRS